MHPLITSNKTASNTATSVPRAPPTSWSCDIGEVVTEDLEVDSEVVIWVVSDTVSSPDGVVIGGSVGGESCEAVVTCLTSSQTLGW